MVNEDWVKAKSKLYQIEPVEADNFNVTSLELEIVLKNRSGKKLDSLEIFNSIEVSPKLPYVYCSENSKQLSSSIHTPENVSDFWCMLCLTSLPVIKPKKRNNIPIRARMGCFGFKCQTFGNGLIKH